MTMTTSASTPVCAKADLSNPAHARAVVRLLQAYALDPMGGGTGLSQAVQEALPGALQRRPNVHVLLAWLDGEPAGVAVCVEGFSTFACQPLLNLHDIAVLPAFRRCGVARALLQAVEALAREQGCCKLTLEVLANNHAAQAAYRKAGFEGYQLDPAAGQALFWQKKLSF